MQVEERALLSVLYVRPLHILRIEVLQRLFESTQYTSDDFRDELLKHGIDCSMSARGNCYDNAVVESFFGLLKRERVNRVRYRTRAEARADLFE